MEQTQLRKFFACIKNRLPERISEPIRNFFTAVFTPILFGWQSGHFKSSFKMKAVNKQGKALPWYTYPCINFLDKPAHSNKTILEFGGGQSTYWWAERSKHVITLEGDRDWFEKIEDRLPPNTDLHFISMENSVKCVQEVKETLNKYGDLKFDIIIIDGLYRYEMIEIACSLRAKRGIIVCDNAEGYGFYKGFKNRELKRVDFFGHAPGVMFPHCTSIYFGPDAFIFAPDHPIPHV